jgi:hypothetical protein
LVTDGERRGREGGRAERLVDVTWVHEDVAGREGQAVGILQAAGTRSLKLEAADDRDRRVASSARRRLPSIGLPVSRLMFVSCPANRSR